MKLIVGLGNPLKEYEKTRHNAGFIVLDSYLKKKGICLTKKKMNGLYQEEVIDLEKVIFLKPQSYINLSGEVIASFLSYYKIDRDDLLIIHDDMDIFVGSFKLKEKGSSAGHNGLKNIEMCLNTNEYNRLKVGISKNKTMDTKDYVLSNFSSEDLEKINSLLDTTNLIIDEFIHGKKMSELMSKYNQKNR